MAEEIQIKATKEQPGVVETEEVVVVSDVPQPDKRAAKESETETEPEPVLVPEREELVPTDDVSKSDGEKVPQSDSFKEESSRVADLPESQKNALEELKQLVQEALENHGFAASSPLKDESKPVAAAPEAENEPKPTDVCPPPVLSEEPTKPEPQTSNLAGDDEAEKERNPEKVMEDSAASDAAVLDDDGAKTVEAIEETVVAVSSTTPSPTSETKAAQNVAEKEAAPSPPPPPPEEVFIWGIRLLEDERSDVILLKFLRARDFKVKDAFNMLRNTVRWRKEFGIDQLLEEDAGLSDLEKVVFNHGHSKEGHPVCYNVYGRFQNKELYRKAFSDEEKRRRFLRWRIQFLEKSIRKLDFSPGGISTIVQINDLKNSPGPAKWELRQATKQALHLLQDNYPEFVAKQVFINVPWWYLAVNRMISPFLTQRTKSKFVFAGPSKSAETLLEYIAAEEVPIEYGGLSKAGEFEASDAVTEVIVKPSAKHTIEFPATQTCLLTWEVRVVGWEVSYGAEFVPSAKDGYTVIIQKTRKVASTEEKVICNSFKIGEPGKVVLTIDNSTFKKKKKLLYRLKSKPSID